MQRECLPHNVILLQLRAGQCPLARAENSRKYYTPVLANAGIKGAPLG